MRLIDADALIRELNEKLGCRTDINKIICGMTVYEPAIVQPQWIPVAERMPENATHPGAFCPRYMVMTKYGVTEGWYNPDRESWFVLFWFMTERLLEHEINFESGDIPRVIKAPLHMGIVTAWMPLPEPYTADAEENEGVQPAHWEKADIPLPYQMRTVPTPSGTFAHREMYVCSACDGYNDKNTQYCPHCGAKMDKEDPE